MYELGKKEYLNKLLKGRYEKRYTPRCAVSSRLLHIVNKENDEEIKAFTIEWLKEEEKRAVSSRLEELLERFEAILS